MPRLNIFVWLTYRLHANTLYLLSAPTTQQHHFANPLFDQAEIIEQHPQLFPFGAPVPSSASPPSGNPNISPSLNVYEPLEEYRPSLEAPNLDDPEYGVILGSSPDAGYSTLGMHKTYKSSGEDSLYDNPNEVSLK